MDPVGILHRGQFPHLLMILPDIAAQLGGIEGIADVCGVGLGNPVGNTALGYSCFKTVRVTDDPVCHKTAITDAHNAQSAAVQGRVEFQHLICKIHQLLVVNRTLFGHDVSKLVSTAVTADGICVEHEISLRSVKLELMVKERSVSAFGTAVDGEDTRVFLIRIIVHRTDDEAVQLHALICVGNMLYRADGPVCIPGIGPARRKALMRTFASLDEVRAASAETLLEIPEMNRKSAESVWKFFHGQENAEEPDNGCINGTGSGTGEDA